MRVAGTVARDRTFVCHRCPPPCEGRARIFVVRSPHAISRPSPFLSHALQRCEICAGLPGSLFFPLPDACLIPPYLQSPIPVFSKPLGHPRRTDPWSMQHAPWPQCCPPYRFFRWSEFGSTHHGIQSGKPVSLYNIQVEMFFTAGCCLHVTRSRRRRGALRQESQRTNVQGSGKVTRPVLSGCLRVKRRRIKSARTCITTRKAYSNVPLRP